MEIGIYFGILITGIVILKLKRVKEIKRSEAKVGDIVSKYEFVGYGKTNVGYSNVKSWVDYKIIGKDYIDPKRVQEMTKNAIFHTPVHFHIGEQLILSNRSYFEKTPGLWENEKLTKVYRITNEYLFREIVGKILISLSIGLIIVFLFNSILSIDNTKFDIIYNILYGLNHFKEVNIIELYTFKASIFFIFTFFIYLTFTDKILTYIEE